MIKLVHLREFDNTKAVDTCCVYLRSVVKDIGGEKGLVIIIEGCLCDERDGMGVGVSILCRIECRLTSEHMHYSKS